MSFSACRAGVWRGRGLTALPTRVGTATPPFAEVHLALKLLSWVSSLEEAAMHPGRGSSFCLATVPPLALCLALVSGCGEGGPDPLPTSPEAPASGFQPLAQDETLPGEDPPTQPDPTDDVQVANLTNGGAPDAQTGAPQAQTGAQTMPSSAEPVAAASAEVACPTYDKLSPMGLTFILDIVDSNQLDSLRKVKRFLRPRDIIVLRVNGGPSPEALRREFPCNRLHALVWPAQLDQLGDMRRRNPRISAVGIDWEGGNLGELGTMIERLKDGARRIRDHHLQPGLVPGGPRSDWAPMIDGANLDFLLAQVQPACKNSGPAFAHAARQVLDDALGIRLGARNVAMEISLNSSLHAQNHVTVERAAECTRLAFGKGARAIYLFGQQRDHFQAFFHLMAELGLRSAR
jgi:hypothetical protein